MCGKKVFAVEFLHAFAVRLGVSCFGLVFVLRQPITFFNRKSGGMYKQVRETAVPSSSGKPQRKTKKKLQAMSASSRVCVTLLRFCWRNS